MDRFAPNSQAKVKAKRMIKRCDRHGNLSLQKTEGFYKHKLIMAEILVNSTDPIQIECFWPDTVKQDFHAMFSIVLKIYRYHRIIIFVGFDLN